MTPHAQAAALHRHYAVHARDRGFPWRAHAEPTWRAALVEGLLAQTPATTVAAHYGAIFAGVDGTRDWLAMDADDRRARVAPLGFADLKLAAVSSLAAAWTRGEQVSAPLLEQCAGVGPYTAAMVALLCGGEGVAVDCNVERVGTRVDGDPVRWVASVLAAAADRPSATGRPAAYEVVSAILDLGATRCAPRAVDCPRCPLAPGCAASAVLWTQCEIPIADPPAPTVYPRTGAARVTVTSLDCDDFEVRPITIEWGTTHPDACPPPWVAAAEPLGGGGAAHARQRARDLHGRSRHDVALDLAAAVAPSGHGWARVTAGLDTVLAWATGGCVEVDRAV